MARVARPIFRRKVKYVAVRPIRVTSDKTIEPGEPVELRTHHLRSLFLRRRIGPAGHPWTEAMLKTRGFYVPEVKGDPDDAIVDQPRKPHIADEPAEKAVDDEDETVSKGDQDAETNEAEADAEEPAEEPLKPVKRGKHWYVGDKRFFSRVKAKEFIEKGET